MSGVKVSCANCKKQLWLIDEWGSASSDLYEYRGAYSCTECFERVAEQRERQRNELISREDARHRFKEGLDVYSDSTVGKHNRRVFKSHLDALKKESVQIKEYERGGW